MVGRVESPGSVNLAQQVSNANADPGSVQSQIAVSVLKESQEVDADIARQLLASATGVGQRIDIKG